MLPKVKCMLFAYHLLLNFKDCTIYIWLPKEDEFVHVTAHSKVEIGTVEL